MVWLLAACICHNRLQVSPYDQEWVVVVGTDSRIVMVVLEWKVVGRYYLIVAVLSS